MDSLKDFKDDEASKENAYSWFLDLNKRDSYDPPWKTQQQQQVKNVKLQEKLQCLMKARYFYVADACKAI